MIKGSQPSLGRLLIPSQSFHRRFNHICPQPSKVVFSGIQPTGIPHLGNYFGALRPWVHLQNNSSPSSTKLIYCIVDLHAITQPQDPGYLRKCRMEMLATLLAIGLDPNRCIIFEQSRVPAHSELMWILSCAASTGYLSRMTQWKTKSGIIGDTSPLDGGKSTAKLKLGLFSYPVLQAADILVHRATEVPVGADQVQHLEFTREVASTFRHAYGEIFPLPKTVLSTAKRVMSLRDPQIKMSKSDKDPKSRIMITDSPEEISLKFRKSVTDSIGNVVYDRQNRPGVANLVEILGYVQGREDFDTLAKEMEKSSMTTLKETVSEAVIEHLKPTRKEYERIIKDVGYLEQVAKEGARKASESAEETMIKVRLAVGLA
ncbi:hypothetical protein EDC01DRAFT_646367 [Geopyxis carbonaria]|nr:hypothetical protein EDC01DRAFT_646367 [Geopyxis carbonaria]